MDGMDKVRTGDLVNRWKLVGELMDDMSSIRRNRYLAIIAVILVFHALRITASVVLPLLWAIFLIALLWPLQRRLQYTMNRGLATLVTFLVLIAVMALFAAAFWFSGMIVGQQWSSYQEQFAQYVQVAEQYGVPVPSLNGLNTNGEQLGSRDAFSALRDLGVRLVRQVFSVTGAFALTIAYMMLGLLEVIDFRTKVKRNSPTDQQERWVDVAEKTANEFQYYVVIRTGIGLLNGLLAGIAVWLIGLDFAFIWGLLTFLLNYIPTIGSVFAVLPPPLFALMQFGDPSLALITLVVLAVIQVVLGVYVDPLIEGHYLSPSPLVVLVSVTFWGWLWGIAGALLGVPLTILIIIACQHSPHTYWLATLLSDVEDKHGHAHLGAKEAMTPLP